MCCFCMGALAIMPSCKLMRLRFSSSKTTHAADLIASAVVCVGESNCGQTSSREGMVKGKQQKQYVQGFGHSAEAPQKQSSDMCAL
jgi:hypothetical protein